MQTNLGYFRRLREAAVERKQLLYALIGAEFGVNGQRLHELEVVPHLVGQARLPAQLRDQVHELRHAGADVARLRPGDQQRLAQVADPDLVFLEQANNGYV